jgi:hypothetical protein
MSKKLISIAIIILCLGFISCKETNGPIVIDDPTVQEPEPFFEGPIVVTDCSDGGGGGMIIAPEYRKISRVVVGSDLIFVGTVSKYDSLLLPSPPDEDKVLELEITEVLKGATNEKYATFKNNARTLIDALGIGDEFMLCLRKDGDGFVFTTATAGKPGYHPRGSIIVITIPQLTGNTRYEEDIYDMKLLLTAYKRNKELFSKAGKQDLLKLYPQFQNFQNWSDVKFYFLQEIEVLIKTGVIDKDDIPALLEWRQMEIQATRIRIIEDLIRLINSRSTGN